MIELRLVVPEATTTKPPTLQFRLAVGVDQRRWLVGREPVGLGRVVQED
jgi:hypothetical protein